MSKAVQRPGSDEPPSEPLTFEAAIQRLESIVEAMENESLPLETLLSQYEQGKRLAQLCQRKLAEAELRIQKLEATSQGETVVKPLDLQGGDAVV